MLDINKLTRSIRTMEAALENSILTTEVKEKIAMIDNHIIDLDKESESSTFVDLEKLYKDEPNNHEKKLADSKLEERKLRMERDLDRYKLEELASKNVNIRIMRKLKTKVDRLRVLIKKFLLERDQEELEELSILQEDFTNIFGMFINTQ